MPRRPRQEERAAAPPRASRAEPIEILGLQFGPFPEITRLNPRFLPGQARLKLTLEIDVSARQPGRTPSSLLEGLRHLLPTLARHRCCGDNRIEETFFKGSRRPACAMRETDDAVDIAHLFEHLVIDLQHCIAEMRICSGVTCGYERPRSRYDLFIESPDRNVSRLCVALSRDLMNDMLRGAAPDPLHLKVAELARRFYQNPGGAITLTRAEAALRGDPRSFAALKALADREFIKPIETTMNFSGLPLYGLARAMEDDGDAGADEPERALT